ncbi:tRNA-guanine transglycosylase [Glarea lozoyensis ATCC 20868]|uniref:Queuine tRNA-ribosyltransferase accessory subunit 2 n=1 Tax=Glarea lozoyensis (strain ATCC 20868 / MF5171) TaxID=1116229 RepID=S3CQG0_GLAL2|nr:tRNA-guanine transglycosylase [Glarea lozoyensis ATCC 20868]EPE27930.1 tRNA-guanine transglycosylase [Glarea lozoyensis ATCC 20868]
MAPNTESHGQQPGNMSFETLKSNIQHTTTARLGKLGISGRKDIETPNFFSIGSRGVVPHLTPDVISAHAQFSGIHMALEDFIERATTGTPPVMNVPGDSPLHTFTALPSHFTTLLAPRRTPAVSAPTGNSNTAISIFTSTGFQVLPNKAYTTYITKLSPDLAVGLADVPYGTVPGTKRIAKMGDRTETWLTELLAAKPERTAIFAPILPIDSNAQSEYLNHLDDIADRIHGLAFYDPNTLPDIPATTALTRLPRLSLSEPRSPSQILRQIALGMDIFTIPFINSATDAGIALDFSFPSPKTKSESTAPLPLGTDMWAATHSTSLLPLSESCTCYACTAHHRAYIQHLLSAKEMLGWALLQIHNHAMLSAFFSAIRTSIAAGTFEEDSDVFARVWESEMPEKTGQGPRVRGYHYKSEGPGEGKKNKAAWGNLGVGVDGGEKDADGKVLEGGLVPTEGRGSWRGRGLRRRLRVYREMHSRTSF